MRDRRLRPMRPPRRGPPDPRLPALDVAPPPRSPPARSGASPRSVPRALDTRRRSPTRPQSTPADRCTPFGHRSRPQCDGSGLSRHCARPDADAGGPVAAASVADLYPGGGSGLSRHRPQPDADARRPRSGSVGRISASVWSPGLSHHCPQSVATPGDPAPAASVDDPGLSTGAWASHVTPHNPPSTQGDPAPAASVVDLGRYSLPASRITAHNPSRRQETPLRQRRSMIPASVRAPGPLTSHPTTRP